MLFAALADFYKHNDNVKFTGDVTVRREELAKEFRAPVSALSPGGVTGIIETDNAYNIIMLKEFESVALDVYKDRIAKKIQKDKQEELYQSLMSRLRQEYSIQIRY